MFCFSPMEANGGTGGEPHGSLPSGKNTAANFGLMASLIPAISFRYHIGFFIGGLQMQTNNNKRFYSPQFSEKAVVSIRRLAWALGLSMPKTIDILVNEISLIFSSSLVCPKCIDKTKCQLCGFHQPAEQKDALSA